MNIIDIVICVALVVGLVMGFKDGAVRQLGSLAGIIIAVIVAKRYSATVAAMLGIGGDYASIWGYVIILLVALIAAGTISYILRKIISFAGLGTLDRLCGAVISAVKYILVMAVLFSLIDSFKGFIPKIPAVESSKLYTPIASTSKYIMPSLEWVGEQIPHTENNGE